jgi:hypothetical protein
MASMGFEKEVEEEAFHPIDVAGMAPFPSALLLFVSH